MARTTPHDPAAPRLAALAALLADETATAVELLRAASTPARRTDDVEREAAEALVWALADAGRRTEAERTIYTPVGLPGQDLALAWAAYQQARRAGRGLEYDFLA